MSPYKFGKFCSSFVDNLTRIALNLQIAVGACVVSHSVMSNSLWPHGLWPTSFLCPGDFSRQEYWSGLPFPTPGELPDPGIKPASPTLDGRFFLTTERPGKPLDYHF